MINNFNNVFKHYRIESWSMLESEHFYWRSKAFLKQNPLQSPVEDIER